MTSPYLGEIRVFAGNFAPVGWALCNGQLMSIADNDVLYTLLGTTYGGDGQTTFALPDLRSRMPIGYGTGLGLSPRTLGQAGGVESVTLTQAQLPVHSHTLAAGGAATSSAAAGALFATTTTDAYATSGTTANLAPTMLDPVGGSQPHDNLAPYLVVNFIIAVAGIYPSQS